MSPSGTSEDEKRAPTWQPRITIATNLQMIDDLKLLETTIKAVCSCHNEDVICWCRPIDQLYIGAICPDLLIHLGIPSPRQSVLPERKGCWHDDFILHAEGPSIAFICTSLAWFRHCCRTLCRRNRYTPPLAACWEGSLGHCHNRYGDLRAIPEVQDRRVADEPQVIAGKALLSLIRTCRTQAVRPAAGVVEQNGSCYGRR